MAVRPILFVLGLMAFAAVRLAIAAPAAEAPRVYLLGGSTMSTGAPGHPIRGWGEPFAACFTDPAIVQNRAASGRSSRSFLAEGRWAAVLEALRPGDYVLIQFGGGNDGKKEDPKRYTDPHTEYRANLERIVRETRAKKAFPLLATMGAIRAWNDRGEFVSPPTEWVDVTRATARELGVPLLDVRALTAEYEAGLGPEGSAAMHLHLPPGKFKAYPKGTTDDTHYSEYGAARVAAIVAREIARQGIPLAAWLKAARE